MERKQGAVVRSSRSIPRHERPRIVVAPRVYMDIMAPSANRPVEKQVTKKQTVQSAPQSTQSFDMKPLKVPSKAVPHTAPALKPISKMPIDIPPELELVVQSHIESTVPVTPEPISSPPVTKVTFEVPAKSTASVKKRKRGSLLKKPAKRHVLHGIAVLLFIVGVCVAADGWLSNRAIQQQASVLGARVQRERPVESKVEVSEPGVLSERLPTGISGYSVASDLPRVVHIPSLKVVAPVLHLDARTDGSLVAPRNIYETGWYKASARPTDKDGAILINGHIDGPTKPGAFYGLKNLKGGEEIVLERGDRRMVTFVVKRVETTEADKIDMAKLLKSIEPGKLGLNLIRYGDESDTTKSRVTVYAVQK